MRRIITSTFATLDGYIDDPHLWMLDFSDEETEAANLELGLQCDALIFGRSTYELTAQAWPTRSGDPFSDHVNAIAKHVVASEPVDAAAWGPAEVIPGAGLVPAVTALKARGGGDILTWGTGRLTDGLAAAGLLDAYVIWTFPVIKGEGEPLFRPASAGKLELLDSRRFASGAVRSTYRPL